MARMAGINIPDNKHAEISLTYIYGIGRKTARDLCEETGVEPTRKIQDLTEFEDEWAPFAAIHLRSACHAIASIQW